MKRIVQAFIHFLKCFKIQSSEQLKSCEDFHVSCLINHINYKNTQVVQQQGQAGLLLTTFVCMVSA